MERYFIIDKFNTFYDWKSIITDKSITDPEPKTNLIELDGMSGTLDLSEALTGEITYKDRIISASFLTDVGNYKDRDKLLKEIKSNLHGKKVKIIEPDDIEHYYIGRIKFNNSTNNLAYATLGFEATCEPWRYAINETVRRVNLTNFETISLILTNRGVKTICPDINVAGNITLTIDGVSKSLSEGDYKITNLKLKKGNTLVTVSGLGSITFTYREADI
jgi:hypothetical protein